MSSKSVRSETLVSISRAPADLNLLPDLKVQAVEVFYLVLLHWETLIPTLLDNLSENNKALHNIKQSTFDLQKPSSGTERNRYTLTLVSDNQTSLVKTVTQPLEPRKYDKEVDEIFLLNNFHNHFQTTYQTAWIELSALSESTKNHHKEC